MIGRTRLRRTAAGLVLAALAGPLWAQSAPCPALVGTLAGLTNLQLTAPAPRPEAGWCVLDGAVMEAGEGLAFVASDLRVRGEAAGAVLTRVELVAEGLRLRPGLGRTLDPVLRDTLRLQTVDLALTLTADPTGLALRAGQIRFSGGSTLVLDVEMAGATLTAKGLPAGRLTRLALDWRNDGKLLRPTVEALGERLEPGASGPQAVDAARVAMRAVAAALPVTLVDEAGAEELAQLIDALPQGRGRLALEFLSESGIGAADLAVAALSDDPLAPRTLERLFSGARLAVDWQPGLAP